MAPTTDHAAGTAVAGGEIALPRWLTRLLIWGLFLGGVYLVRDFFFTAFLTFLFSYLTLAVVGRAMARLAPGRERPGLRRLLVLAVFMFVPLLLLLLGILVGPRMVEQGQHVAGWLSQLDPEAEVASRLEGTVGGWEFAETYGKPGDPRYALELEQFKQSGQRRVAAFQSFPAQQALVEGTFVKRFMPAERNRARQRLTNAGTESKEFAQWFLTSKAPDLQQQARQPPPPDALLAPLVRAAAKEQPEQLLDHARHDPAMLAVLRQEWLTAGEENAIRQARAAPTYQAEYHAGYDELRRHHPTALPYTFEQYVVLKKAHAEGMSAFADALDEIAPIAADQRENQLRADFEAAKKHELFQHWWSTSSTAQLIRRHVGSGSAQGAADRMDHVLSSLIDIPIAVGTALLLSLFICIDFPRMRERVRKLRGTWLREVYDELVPALARLGELVGRAMRAQGLIALCNALIMFCALSLVGVAHAVLLAGAVFVLCLVPTLGMVIAWVLIAGMALIQPGGGMLLALQATGAVLVVILLESFVFSPRILGKMMELHPVLIISILPIAQYFFGVWGLILATPVAVYVVHELIFRRSATAAPSAQVADDSSGDFAGNGSDLGAAAAESGTTALANVQQ